MSNKAVQGFNFRDPEYVAILDKIVKFENEYANGAYKISRIQAVRLLISLGHSYIEQGKSIANMQTICKKN